MPELARSRRFIALSAIVLFLALDAARSLIGHFGYAKPVSIWHPDPAVYADMTWPPASNAPLTRRPDSASMSTLRLLPRPGRTRQRYVAPS